MFSAAGLISCQTRAGQEMTSSGCFQLLPQLFRSLSRLLPRRHRQRLSQFPSSGSSSIVATMDPARKGARDRRRLIPVLRLE